MRIREHFLQVKESLFPTNFTCDLCGTEVFGDTLCPDCKKTVPFNNATACPLCGRKTARAETCLECKERPPLYKRAISPLVYADGSAILVGKFKNGSPYLGEFFGDLIVEKLIGFPKIDVIVYVPLTKFSLFRRGYNPSELIARQVSYKTMTPKLNVIARIKRGKPQKGLTKKERESNVSGAFRVKEREKIKGKSVLLIDDVLTTGATADEIAKILRSAGAREVYVATAASVEYKPATKKQPTVAK